jgi:hypothetical protein
MPKGSPDKRRCRSGPIAALFLFAVLVLYPLSIGPAWGWVSRGWLSGTTVATIYRPLDYLPGWMPEYINWYVGVCV